MQAAAAPVQSTRSSARLRKRGHTASSGPSPESPVSSSSVGAGKDTGEAMYDSCVAEATRVSEKSSPSSTPTAKRLRINDSDVTGKVAKSAPGQSRRRESTSTVATTPGVLRLGSSRPDDTVIEMEGVSDGPMMLDRLRAPEKDGGAGLTTGDIQKLIDQGIGTVEALAFAPTRHISSLKGVSEQKAERLKRAALSLIPMGFQSAGQYLEQRSSMIRISTGCPSIDALLRGGVETGSITEVFGESRSGKSQFCHALCVAAQLPVSQGGAAGRSLYIDTEGTFRPERLADMGQKWGLDRDTVLSNVAFARAYNSEHQQQLLLDAASVMSASRYALVVVDSVTNLLRSEFQGRGELAERQQLLGRLLRMLQRIADEYGVAVVLTNQVVANVDPGPAMFTNPANATKPIGGNILAHSSQTRLQLRKGQASEKRILKVYDSPCLPESECAFSITANGLADYVKPPQRDAYEQEKRKGFKY